MALSRSGGYDFRNLLTHRILVLSNTLGKGAVRLYAERFGMPLAEWRLLAALVITGPASVNVLAGALQTDKGWISRTVSSLLDKGLVVARPVANDGRSFEVTLTEKGRATYRHIVPAALDRHRRLLEIFTGRELALLDRFIDRLQRRAETLADDSCVELPASKLRRRRNGARTARREKEPA